MALASMFIALVTAWSPTPRLTQGGATDVHFWVGDHVVVSIGTNASSAKPQEGKRGMYVAGKRAYGLETGLLHDKGLRVIATFNVDVYSRDSKYRMQYRLPSSLWADCFYPLLKHTVGDSLDTQCTLAGLESWANADASQVFLLLRGSDGGSAYEMYYSLDLKRLMVKRQAVIDNGIIATLWVRLPTPQKIFNRQK